MKKNLLPVLLFLISIFFFACKNNSSGNSIKYYDEKYLCLESYKKIDTTRLDFSNGNAELYMFVYNVGDVRIESDSYEDIFAGRVRSIVDANFEGGGIIPQQGNEYAHYTCGLSSERIRNAYKNRRLAKNTARAVGSEPIYDRSKNKAASNIGDEEVFYKEYTESDGKTIIESLKATCRYSNDDCQIFVENGFFDSSTSEIYKKISEKECKVTQAGVERLAEKFSIIYNAEQALLGKANLDNVNYNAIIETSEKITILIANLGIEDSGSITMGYFYPNDIWCDYDAPVEFEGGTLYSNQRMMFTVNVLEYGAKTTNGEESLYSTLGHEFNHMINYIEKKFFVEDGTYEIWFTEMLSAITEDFIPPILEIDNTVQKSRIPDFNYKSERGMIDWYGNGDVFASYGFAYAFGAYLVRNYGGVELIHQMATNPFDGKEAITAALKACGYDETFESVFLKFGLIMANADGSDPNVPTLKKSVSGNVDGYTYNFYPVNLYDFNSKLNVEILKYFDNPNWNMNNYSGPCFYRQGCYPLKIYGNAFYAVYLGKVRDWRNSLKFNPPMEENIQAYIYVRN